MQEQLLVTHCKQQQATSFCAARGSVLGYADSFENESSIVERKQVLFSRYSLKPSPSLQEAVNNDESMLEHAGRTSQRKCRPARK
jgi:hypothetical protein